MQIISSAFEHNQNIPVKYTCDGENINPPLEVVDLPENTQSLVIIMDDPDAPNGTWVHWTVWNIAPTTKMIPASSVPSDAIEGETSFGRTGYGGPCPHAGTHHYFFKLYALDTNPDLDPAAEKEQLVEAMEGHVLEKAELVGLYARQ